MTTAFWCVLLAALLPYPWVLAAKANLRYNNHAPRAYLDKLSGWRQRAYWAHLNTLESVPLFAAAVIIAHQAHAPQAALDQLAQAFIGLRIVYGLLYIADIAWLRSVVWFGAVACCVAMFLLAGGMLSI